MGSSLWNHSIRRTSTQPPKKNKLYNPGNKNETMFTKTTFRFAIVAVSLLFVVALAEPNEIPAQDPGTVEATIRLQKRDLVDDYCKIKCPKCPSSCMRKHNSFGMSPHLEKRDLFTDYCKMKYQGCKRCPSECLKKPRVM